jgi:O-antigen/teichoic acid export membrane protein
VAARRAGISIQRRFSWSRLRSLLALGFPLRVVDFPQQIIATLDLLVVTKLLGVRALAIYSFARLVFLQAATVPGPIGNVFVMRAFRLTGANVSRSDLARDAREFLLLEYLVVLPLVICAAVQVFGLLTVTVLPAYTRSTAVLSILIFAVYFVPQTTIIRNFWMIDRRFRRIAVSNIVGLLAHGIGLAVAIWIDGLSLTAIAAGTLAGWAGYYAWIIATVGRELFGARSAVTLALHAVTGAALTRVILWIVPAISGHHGNVDAVLQTARNLGLSVLLLAPLAAYGLWRTDVRRHFRLPASVDQD